MPRNLKFQFKDIAFECGMNKVDRNKLYGSVSVETFDVDGNKCGLASLANDGKTLIPHGGTAFAYINKDGLWVERSELQPVSLEGEKLEVLPSSFDQVIELGETVTIEEFLNHSVRLCYHLDYDADEIAPEMIESMATGTIFRFEFLYRDGITADPAFLMTGNSGELWMLVAKPASVDYVGLDQAAVTFAADSEDEESDEFDFEMM